MFIMQTFFFQKSVLSLAQNTRFIIRNVSIVASQPSYAYFNPHMLKVILVTFVLKGWG